jgi:AcrR family transcriptional regulator
MPRGRPMTFDKDVALQRAMGVFWRDGFEGASVHTLIEAMGIRHAPSFYKAYGDKTNLFRLAVEHYATTVGAGPLTALDSGETIDAAVAAMLTAGVDLIVSGAVNCTPENADVTDFLAAYRIMIATRLVDRLRRAAAADEIPAETDFPAVAEFYAALLHGIAVRARDGASSVNLLAAAQFAPTVTSLCRSDGR